MHHQILSVYKILHYRFSLKDGQLWLGHQQALMVGSPFNLCLMKSMILVCYLYLQVWESLADRPAFPSDREACFKWFSKVSYCLLCNTQLLVLTLACCLIFPQLVSDEPDIEPETAKKIFTDNVHKIAPHTLTENGFR